MMSRTILLVLFFVARAYPVQTSHTAPSTEPQSTLNFSLSEDTGHGNIDAIVPSVFEAGAYAVVVSSNKLSRPSAANSHVIYLNASRTKLWEDRANNFWAPQDSLALVETGVRAFILVGQDEKGRGAIRIITGSPGTPKVECYYYEGLPAFRSIAKTATGDFAISAWSAKEGSLWVLLIRADGTVIRKLRVFKDLITDKWLNMSSNQGAIVTSTGNIVAFATNHSKNQCVVLASAPASLEKVSWEKMVCEEGIDLGPTSAAATNEGAFVIAGRLQREIAQEQQSDGWDIKRHRSFVLGFDKGGTKTFDYRTKEVSHWLWMGYNSVAYNPRSKEIVAVGSLPYAAVVSILSDEGELIEQGLYQKTHNADLSAISLLPNGTGYLIGGTVGHYPRRGFVTYNAAVGTLSRR